MHSSVLAFLNIGSSEMILIVFVALLLFGGEKLPEIARGLGKGIRDFKDASEGVKREINNQINNYEEKREENKRVEEAIIATQDPAQNNLPAHPEGFAPVENTIPVSESHFSTSYETPGEVHAEGYTEPVIENHPVVNDVAATTEYVEHHPAASANETATSEHTKNT